MIFFSKHLTRQSFTLFLPLFFTLSSLNAQETITFKTDSIENFILTAVNLKFYDPDSSASLLKKSFQKSMANQDTLTAIQSLIHLSEQNAQNANFGEAYDGYWEALLLLDKIKSEELQASTYIGLAWLYYLYERHEEAVIYFNKSLALNKKLLAQGKISDQTLRNNYYALAIFYRNRENTTAAKIYLDSCMQVPVFHENDRKTRKAYVQAETGYIYFIENQKQKALETLLPLNTYFSEKHQNYLIIYHKFLADLYLSMNEIDNAEKFYRSAIKYGIKHKSHQDFLPELYEKLSKILLEKRKYEEAYSTLLEAKEQNEQQFGSRSAQNLKFIEIKDTFRQEKEAQAQFIQEQKLVELEQEDKIWYLKTLIAYCAVVLLLFICFFIYRHFRQKIKTEKHIMLERQKLQQEQAKEILEIKNKELTASTLQIIERDEMLVELKSQLKEHSKDTNSSKLHKLAKNIDINRSNNWKEFEARFVEVNGDFYKTLNEKFPQLTQGDQKVCALIKLNFDSKEMSKLLGISTESVHTTRYRLRKKLGLSRKDNLEEFIASLH